MSVDIPTTSAKEARIAAFRDDHLGMFIHWGPYSIRGIEASWPLFRGTVPWAEYEAMADVFGRYRLDFLTDCDLPIRVERRGHIEVWAA